MSPRWNPVITIDDDAQKVYTPKLATTARCVVGGITGYLYESRFPQSGVTPTTKDREDWRREFLRSPLPTFEAATEKQFEAWCDELAEAVRVRVCRTEDSVLVKILMNVFPASLRAVTTTVGAEVRSNIEAFLSTVAKAKFTQSSYVDVYISDVVTFTVEDLCRLSTKVRSKLHKYVRLATRWDVNQEITARR